MPASSLREAMELLPDAVLFADRAWTVTLANSEARVLWPALEVVGAKLWTLLPEMRDGAAGAPLRQAMEHARPAETELYLERPIGRWFEIACRPIAGGLALFFHETTEHHAAEERRAESSQLLEEVFEATADAILSVGPDWRCTYANVHARELLPGRLLVGDALWTRIPELAVEPFAGQLRRTMQDRVVTEFEGRAPGAVTRWLRVIVRPFQDGIVIAAVDITARRAAEQEREEAARALGQVLEVTSDGILAVDRAWRITFANRRALELAAPLGTLAGDEVWERFPVARDPRLPFWESWHRAMREGVVTSCEAFYPAPLRVWLSVDAYPTPEGLLIFLRDVTADRMSGEALRTQAHLLATVQQAAAIATWELELRSGRISFGAGSTPVFGRPLEATPSIAALDACVPPAYRQVLGAMPLRMPGTGVLGSAEFPVVAENGELLWIENRRDFVYSDGKVTHVRGISMNVTARKRTEEQRERSERRYRALTDLNPQFIWMGSSDGHVTYANQRLLEYLGESFVLGGATRWGSALYAEDHARVSQLWKQSVATGDEYSVEARLVGHADGAPRWFHVRALPMRDETGAIESWLGVAIDIHESRTFAETLRAQQAETERQRAELESIYESTPVGLALFDPVEFRYLRLNDELARIIGLPKEQILGRSVLEVLPGVATVGELFRQVAGGKPVRDRVIEGEQASTPGVKRAWNVNYFPVYDRSGTITGITTASLEITQQRKAEAALIQTEKLAAVGRLASSISHEINNPLEAITNLLYLLAQSPELPQDLRVFVHTAQSELQRVSQIATQTLRFHRQAVGATQVTAAQLVNAVLNLYQGRLVNSGIRVRARYASQTEILCFENDIRQVLNNLIANAIDAMRKGGELRVRAHDVHLADGTAGVRITVGDTGHGMSGATLKRLFEPFFTTKGLNGTGLGLWISSGIAERHQGRLRVRSSQHPVYHGTVFTLSLPLAEHPAPAAEA